MKVSALLKFKSLEIVLDSCRPVRDALKADLSSQGLPRRVKISVISIQMKTQNVNNTATSR